MDKYINISAIAGHVGDIAPGYAIQSWLRDRNTLEFLMLWESKYNPDFDKVAYGELIERSKGNQATITPKLWIESTKAIGITSKQGRYGGTYAHPAIACEFMMSISPRYRLMLVETFRLSEEGGDPL